MRSHRFGVRRSGNKNGPWQAGAVPIKSSSWLRRIRVRWGLLGYKVDATVPLEQTLVGGRQEREPVEIVLVVDFGAFGEAGKIGRAHV